MTNLAMDIITGSGYPLIPGFVALILFLSGYCSLARYEAVKADRLITEDAAAVGSRMSGRR
jgi:hypothetical protein